MIPDRAPAVNGQLTVQLRSLFDGGLSRLKSNVPMPKNFGNQDRKLQTRVCKITTTTTAYVRKINRIRKSSKKRKTVFYLEFRGIDFFLRFATNHYKSIRAFDLSSVEQTKIR